jgi:hypothetical protein
MSENRNSIEGSENDKQRSDSTFRQEQADPPITEIRGFFNSNEDLEPTLTDGRKAPDKAEEEHKRNQEKEGK